MDQDVSLLCDRAPIDRFTSDFDACLGNNLDDLIHVASLFFIDFKAFKYLLYSDRLSDHDVTTDITIRSWGMNRTGFH